MHPNADADFASMCVLSPPWLCFTSSKITMSPSMHLNFPSSLLGIFRVLSYAPIALFAEDFRAFNGVLYAIMSDRLSPPGLTGSIKDLRRLWYLNQHELFSELKSEHQWTVASLRHGNTFPLVNKRLLDLAGITGRISEYDAASEQEDYYRPTTVNVAFIMPGDQMHIQPYGRFMQAWRHAVMALPLMACLIVLAIALFLNGLHSSSLLVVCSTALLVVMMALRIFTTPIFGNGHAIHKDSTIKASGGAALDVHVITSDWNSNTVDIICGYSSQLHSLTNIPIRLRNFRAAYWLFRLLAVVLTAQAAILASLIGESSAEAVGPTIWLALYLITWLPLQFTGTKEKMSRLLEKQPAKVECLPSLTFKRRRTALLFIASLPFSAKADKWKWLDSYMPNNSRRQTWQEEFEQMQQKVELSERATALRKVSEDMQGAIADVEKIWKTPFVHKQLERYKSDMGWTGV